MVRLTAARWHERGLGGGGPHRPAPRAVQRVEDEDVVVVLSGPALAHVVLGRDGGASGAAGVAAEVVHATRAHPLREALTLEAFGP